MRGRLRIGWHRLGSWNLPVPRAVSVPRAVLMLNAPAPGEARQGYRDADGERRKRGGFGDLGERELDVVIEGRAGRVLAAQANSQAAAAGDGGREGGRVVRGGEVERELHPRVVTSIAPV